MMKKTVFAALLLLVMSVSAIASEVGSWSIYPVFSGSANTRLIDTDSKVYYLANGWLYSYDKSADETVYYTKINGMSDVDISSIYYNYDKKFLMVVYSNSNIDIVRDNGRVDNIPDLKNVILSVSKKINDVDFDGNTAYVATDFGYMVVDCDKCVTKESFNYGKAFTSIIATDNYIYASYDKKLQVAPKKGAHYEISCFSETTVKQDLSMYKISSDSFLASTGWLYYVKIGEDPTQINLITVESALQGNLSMSGNKAIASYSGKYIEIAADGTTNTVTLPEGVDGTLLSSYNGKGLWNLDSKGLREISVGDSGITVLHDYYLPNTSTVIEPYYLKYYNGALYSMNSGVNYKGATARIDIALSMLKDGKWSNLAPTEYTITNSSSKGTLKSPYGLAIDPNDNSKIWFGTYFEGVYCIENGKQVQKFDNTNSPFYMNYVCNVTDLEFDKDGNLWFIFFNYSNASYEQIYVLPKSKLYGSVTKDDFIAINLNGVQMSYENEMLVTKNGRYVIGASNVWKTKLAVVDTNNTPLDTSDDVVKVLSSYTDQDGKSIDLGYIFSIVEDSDGKIWLGTNTGVCVINNPANIINGTLTINRIKVPRNDGTNLADYLLDGISVSSIAIDGAGRKWIGTTTSGLYLVKSDGSEILEHFTTENSTLTDDLVTAVECSTDDNRVFIGTKKGLLVYESDASPAQTDYSDVYAYPNPVRPDYSGYITIAGLMDNSLVKIADSMGNVIYSGRSTGGMFVWDGCNSDGSRVNTGVYYVFASQNEDGHSSGCVSKILVVK